MDFNTNLTEKGNLIVNTAHCTNRAENPVFIEILISAVLLQHCTNTTLTLYMHCLHGIALQLQHYNKSMLILKIIYAFTENVVTFCPNHPSINLRSSFVHPSIGSWRMIIGSTEDNMKMKRNISHRQFIAP